VNGEKMEETDVKEEEDAKSGRFHIKL